MVFSDLTTFLFTLNSSLSNFCKALAVLLFGLCSNPEKAWQQCCGVLAVS